MTTGLPTDLPVTSDAELTERWRLMMQLDEAPTRRTLFLAWLRADGVMVRLLLPVENVPVEPDPGAIDTLRELHAAVAASEGDDLHLAMYLERPHSGPEDDNWRTAVEAGLRDRDGVDCSLHVGDGGTVTPLLPRRAWRAG